MKQAPLMLLEVVLLFGALFFTLPYAPSDEIEHIPLFPAAAFSVALFAGSRFLRWRPRLLMPLAETAAFSLFVLVLNEAINLIYTTSA